MVWTWDWSFEFVGRINYIFIFYRSLLQSLFHIDFNDYIILLLSYDLYSSFAHFVSDVQILVDKGIKILAILRHCFKLRLNVTETAHKIWKMEGNETKYDGSAQNGYKIFNALTNLLK